MEATEYRPFEVIVEKSLINSFQKTGGVTSLAYSIEFLGIVVMQILFIILFAMREFMIIFLFAFAPVFIFMDALYFLLRKNKNVLGSFFSKYIFSLHYRKL